ncbi:MAG: transketolase C-terminal domain-containing protein [Parachlamydiales bacterium]|jgi:pyruvate dehydrogenase E1 component beta subunit
MSKRELSYAAAIKEATEQMMEICPEVYLMGLGVPDPKGIFGTTLGLKEKFGPKRVLDMPVSENALTGIAIGSALLGLRPIMTHQRADFFFLALDQMVNNAAKWSFMFGKQLQVPLVVRLILGRGWGQGPQHSQSLHSILAHFPGLKVVMPSNAYDAKGLLVSSIEDSDPVIFIEHRWLHNIKGEVPQGLYREPIGKAKILKEGRDLTIVGCSQMVLEAFKAEKILKELGLSAEIIDLRTIAPLDKKTILASIKKTGRLLVLDPDWLSYGLSAEIISLAAEEAFRFLKAPPKRMAYPDEPSPTSWALANYYYPIVEDIVSGSLCLMGKEKEARVFEEKSLQKKALAPLDVPDASFTGPF